MKGGKSFRIPSFPDRHAALPLRYYLAIVGSVLLAGACWLFVRRIALILSGVTASGRIEAFETRRSDDSGDKHDSLSFFPVVSFTDCDGKLRRFTAVAGGATQRPPVGTTVVVRYSRTDPQCAFIASFLHMWGAPLALAALGIGSLLAYRLW
jgi:hypothetical protein